MKQSEIQDLIDHALTKEQWKRALAAARIYDSRKIDETAYLRKLTADEKKADGKPTYTMSTAMRQMVEEKNKNRANYLKQKARNAQRKLENQK